MDEMIHGFRKLYSCHLDDYKAEGVLYRHVRTGMEVFSVTADDSEYFFSYAFRTLPEDSTGVFHILEHTVLSGSRKYPGCDPFSALDSHSCNSYMNALTCPDRTLYPAASPVKKDFDNIFSLYTDSVFHPLLRREDFEKEGIRVGREGFEGVVFNEMRGDTLQCESIASSVSKRALFTGSPYFYSSGGDVRQMISLSWESYLETYEKYYNPANCRLFLYGRDIDTAEKLRLLDEEYLQDREPLRTLPCVCDTVRWQKPERQTVLCQASGSDKGEFILSFLTEGHSYDSYDNIFVSVLVDALLGGPANPLYSALLESRLGSELSEQSGMSADFNEIPFSVGMGGVREEDAGRLEDFILSTLKKIAQEGIEKDILEASVRRQEFLLQEVSGGIPNGLRIFLKCIRGWERGLRLDEVLSSSSCLKKLRSDWKERPRLFEQWMEKNLIDNPHRLSLYVKPSQTLVQQQEEYLDSCWQKRKSEYHELPVSQEREVDLPLLTIDDIREEEAKIVLERAGEHILIQSENTCGISYVNFVSDLSDLPSHELLYAVLLSRYLLVCGLEDVSASQFHGALRLESGGYYAYLETGRAADAEVKAFFVIRIKCLTRQLKVCLDLLYDWVSRADTADRSSFDDAMNDLISDYEANVEEAGSSFASSLASASLSASCSLGEKLMGISSWQSLSRLTAEQCFEGLGRMMQRLRDRNRMTLHITSQEEDRAESSALAAAFVSRFTASDRPAAGLVRPVEEESRRIWYRLSSSVCYNALALRTSPFMTREQEAEALYANIFSSTALWDEMRLNLGAYGAEGSVDNMEEVFTVATYRDAHVAKSFEAIVRALKNTEISSDSVDNARLIRLGRLLKPLSPSQKATIALRRFMYGISDEMRSERRSWLRTISADEVRAAGDRIAEGLSHASYASLSPESVFMEERIEGCDERILPSGSE